LIYESKLVAESAEDTEEMQVFLPRFL